MGRLVLKRQMAPCDPSSIRTYGARLGATPYGMSLVVHENAVTNWTLSKNVRIPFKLENLKFFIKLIIFKFSIAQA